MLGKITVDEPILTVFANHNSVGAWNVNPVNHMLIIYISSHNVVDIVKLFSVVSANGDLVIFNNISTYIFACQR